MDTQLTNLETGLTDEQITSAPKNIPSHHATDAELTWIVLKNQLFSFFFIILLVSGILSYFLNQTVDACIFFVIALINVSIGFNQEYHATKSTQALEKLVTHQVTVKRNGNTKTIPSTEVVLGDLVIAESGDVIVTDLLVRSSNDVFVDESIRTGETLPRQAKEQETLLAGVHIIQGNLIGQVIAVGEQSSIIKYADKISQTQKNSSFEEFLTTISRNILVATVFCLALVFVANVLIAHSLLISEYALYAISLFVGVVPEALPLVISIILTREALLLAKSQVIVKKLSVLENLGSMDYLLTDKTGTMTENTLRVEELIDQKNITTSIQSIVFGSYERTPMDRVFDLALQEYLESHQLKSSTVQENLLLSPFQITRGYSLYTLPSSQQIIRGQYMSVCNACSSNTDIFKSLCIQKEQQGLRIIAFATKSPEQKDFILTGGAVFEDPLKADAILTYQEIKGLGIHPRIITGDSIQVASYIGKILDPAINEQSVFSMDSWNSHNQEELKDYKIFARCSPDQKSILIDQYLKHGVVGFLGEGINDAIALKHADIGFVVNNASDVARQSGDVLLLEKSLSPIISAIEFSRKAYLHIKIYVLCTLSGSIGTLLSLTFAAIFLRELPMLPTQILLINFLTDIPLIFLLSDNLDNNATRQPIKNNAKKFFSHIFIFGFASTIFDFIFFYAFHGYDISILRTGWFVFSVLAELTLVFTLRSELSLFKAPKIASNLQSALILCYGLAIILPFVPFGHLFKLEVLSSVQLMTIIGITLIYLVANECIKFFVFPKKVE